jgi:hypothetical protein
MTTAGIVDAGMLKSFWRITPSDTATLDPYPRAILLDGDGTVTFFGTAPTIPGTSTVFSVAIPMIGNAWHQISASRIMSTGTGSMNIFGAY